MKRSLVISDTHGHYNRLVALLEQERITRGGKRVNFDVRVIHVGDVGHFGHNAPPEDDQRCWEAAEDFFDKIILGNHDMAALDNYHKFSGYKEPLPETRELVRQHRASGLAVLACQANGYLVTHAGLHPYFDGSHALPSPDEPSPEPARHLERERFQVMDDLIEYVNHNPDAAIVRAISRRRGGFDLHGGLLWRDSHEALSSRWPQVFGHTQLPQPQSYNDGTAFNIDVGGINNGRLAAIWLPEKKIVQVQLDEISYQ